MTRIIAGVAAGRRLTVPGGLATRPTSDRAREGLFGTVTAVLGTLAGATVLDLYAGSGAVALEALSRGAADAILVESDPRAAQVIRANIAALGLPGARVLAGQAGRVLARGPGELPRRTFVFADPPYQTGADEVRTVLSSLLTGGWLGPAALVAVERATRSGPWSWPDGYEPDRSRRYGEATLWYGLAARAEDGGTAPAGE